MGYSVHIRLTADGGLHSHEDVVADLWAEATNPGLSRYSEGIAFRPADEGSTASFKPGRKDMAYIERMVVRLDAALPRVTVRVEDDFEVLVYETPPVQPFVDPVESAHETILFEGDWTGHREGPHVERIDLEGDTFRVTFGRPFATVEVLVLFETETGVKDSDLTSFPIAADGDEQHYTVDLYPEVVRVELLAQWRDPEVLDQLFRFPIPTGTPAPPAPEATVERRRRRK